MTPTHVTSIFSSESPSSEFIREDILEKLRSDDDEDSTMDTDIIMSTAHALADMLVILWDMVCEATTSDPIMTELLDIIEEEMMDSKLLLPPTLREYFPFQEHLSMTNGLILFKDRIVISPSLHEEVLKSLDASHQSVPLMAARADTSTFWPGSTPQITHHREHGMDCNRITLSQPDVPPT